MRLIHHHHRGLNTVLKFLLVTNGFVLLAGAMLGPIYALFVKEVGGDILEASLAGTLFAVAGGITVLISERYVDRLKRPEYIMAAGYAIMGIGFFSYLFVGAIWQILLIQVLLGLGEATYSPAYNALYSRHLDKNKEGAEWGLWEAMAYFVMASGSLIGGYIASTIGFSALFILMTIFCLGSALFILGTPNRFFH